MRGALYVVCRLWLARRMDVVSVAVASVSGRCMALALMGTDTRCTMMAVLRNVWQELVRVIDGDDFLIVRQDDANIKLWNMVRIASEVTHGTGEHLLGTSQMKAQV